MSEIDKEQLSIIEEFKSFNDWEARYKRLIDLGRALPPLPEKYKTKEYKVNGCQSQVWMCCDLDKDKNMLIHADSEPEAQIVKGLIALLIRVFSKRDLQSIMMAKPFFIADIGLSSHLSPSRTNGLMAMIKQIKFYAMALEAGEKAKASKLN